MITTENQISRSIRAGLKSLERPVPVPLSEWADEHFYLSTESSYTEGRWETLPYQKPIMDMMSNDDIRELVFIKSARLGYTKMIMAFLLYNAIHRKRNQGIWQPTDDDADEFVKTEIDPLLRDVPEVRTIFPSYGKRSRNNTLRQKIFIGSNLHIRGGKAAKNYRRLSIDVAITDELDGFDRDIEKEGDARTLKNKRIEGSSFPKSIDGSTPKTAGASNIEDAADKCEMFFEFYIPCPHCDQMHKLELGDRDTPFGFKWTTEETKISVSYLCPHCAALYSQSDYMDIYHRGKMMTTNGIWIDSDCIFRGEHNEIVDPPLSAAVHVWTAYSPMTTWSQIVREFIAVDGDINKLKSFYNTTLGKTFSEEETESVDPGNLMIRREYYDAEVPTGVKVIVASVDTQDDRFEIQFDGYGKSEEKWTLDHVRLYGDPSKPVIWDKLAGQIRRTFKSSDGSEIEVKLAVQDHGGHYSDEVNAFSKRMGVRFLIPIKGYNAYNKPLVTFPRKRNNKGVYLTMVGTDTGKALVYHRYTIADPGPGCMHWPIADWTDETYFKQATAEERRAKYKLGVKYYEWDSGKRRNEISDLNVYSLAAVRILTQHFGLNLNSEAVAGVRSGKNIDNKGGKPNNWVGKNNKPWFKR